jgi:hypothetical protein
MKTPIQELIETFEEMRSPIDSKVDVDFAISLMKSILEKEKDVITYAYERGFLAGWMHENCKPLTYYNETFNTKEK